MAIPRHDTNFAHYHAHSKFSVLDGTSEVSDLVKRAHELGQPALALTDHGNLGGAVQLYQNANKYGIKPFIGLEGYLIDPEVTDWDTTKERVDRFHFGIIARTEEGYKGLVKFSSMTHTRPRFNRFPRASINDIIELGGEYGDDLILTSGCYFGYVQQGLMQSYDVAYERADMLSQVFPNMFMEAQHHNIHHENEMGDDEIVESIIELADSLGIGVIATQDGHYTNQKDKSAHELMKQLGYGGGDNEFPGDSFHLASADWVAEHYSQEQWDLFEDSYDELLDMHDLKIKPLDTFKVDVPKISKNPKKKFQDSVSAAHKTYTKDMSAKNYDTYTERMAYEMDIILTLGMEEYFNIVEDYVKWCHQQEITVEARGSGNGSYVCFLLGITQVDPIIWGVDFDRFLSKDRTKPADIDMDVEDARRKELVDYLLAKYEAVNIGTWGKMGTRYDEVENVERGSILVSWKSAKRRQCEEEAYAHYKRMSPNVEPKVGEYKARGAAMFNKYYAHINDVRDVATVEPDEYEPLRRLSELQVFKSYGCHAGGILLSGEHIKIEDYIPTMLVASSNTRVTQFDMDDVEEFGLLKMDILGQATLRTMKLAQEMIGRADPTNFDWIPNDDKDATKILREGRTNNGIFHFEGWTKAKGGKEMGIRSTKDAILASALYMPGAMNSGQTAHYNDMRKNADKRRSIQYIHPIFEKHLKETHGAYVYQNQVMSILRDLGFDIPSINVFLKVVKDSGAGSGDRNAERIVPLKAQFDKLWKQHGIDPAEREGAWDALCGFAVYGFNKAHASGYGIRSYRCAYLKAHYPLEYMTALLQTWAGRQKEDLYVKEVRRMEIRIMPPHINISGDSWSIDRQRKAIRRGLLSIKGVGAASAKAIADGQPYSSLTDLYNRTSARAVTGMKDYLAGKPPKGVTEKLIEARAFRDVPLVDVGEPPF